MSKENPYDRNIARELEINGETISGHLSLLEKRWKHQPIVPWWIDRMEPLRTSVNQLYMGKMKLHPQLTGRSTTGQFNVEYFLNVNDLIQGRRHGKLKLLNYQNSFLALPPRVNPRRLPNIPDINCYQLHIETQWIDSLSGGQHDDVLDILQRVQSTQTYDLANQVREKHTTNGPEYYQGLLETVKLYIDKIIIERSILYYQLLHFEKERGIIVTPYISLGVVRYLGQSDVILSIRGFSPSGHSMDDKYIRINPTKSPIAEFFNHLSLIEKIMTGNK